MKKAKITKEVKEILEEQRQKFIKKFGREPQPDDPIFFDAPPQEEVHRQILEAMEKAGTTPELVYAYKKTGRILTEEASKNLSKKELKEWQDAIDDYFELQKRS